MASLGFLPALLLATTLAASLPAPAAAQATAAGERRETREEARGLREIVYRDGEAVEERLISPDGFLIEELYRGPEGEPQTIVYLRSSSRLVRAEARDASGELVGAMDYRYDRNGRLLGVSATGILGPDSAGILSAGGTPLGSWTSSASGTSVVTYDAKGRPLENRSGKEGAVALSEKRTYSEGPDAGPSSKEIGDKASGNYISMEYDAQGKPTLRLEYAGGSLAAKTEFSYGDRGLLVLERTSRAGSIFEKALFYDEAGSPAREET
ncbi:MAG: hypothetical protein Q8M76_00780, partial [Spirochaetaceae bacterium]|nr:hypothetical protein [Spirochaetaceae bacterium]